MYHGELVSRWSRSRLGGSSHAGMIHATSLGTYSSPLVERFHVDYHPGEKSPCSGIRSIMVTADKGRSWISGCFLSRPDPQTL